jgi:hypothetical protein
MLAERGALCLEVSVEEARDIVWTLSSLAVHDLLVVERSWNRERYEAWLSAAITAALFAHRIGRRARVRPPPSLWTLIWTPIRDASLVSCISSCPGARG